MDQKKLLIILVLLVTLYLICKYRLSDDLCFRGDIGENNHQAVLTVYEAQGVQVVDAGAGFSTDVSSGLGGGKELDYAAGAPIDLNRTGEMAVFIGGAQDDALLMPNGRGGWVDVIDQTNLNDASAVTYSAVSADLDHNGLTDLVVARSNGVKLYLNQGRGHFIVRELLQESDISVPVGLAITDYNKDGNPDIYVSQYTHPSLVRHGDQSTSNFQEGLGSKLSDTGRNADGGELTDGDLSSGNVSGGKVSGGVVDDIMLEGLGTGMFEDVTHMVNLGKGGEVTTRKGNLGRRSSSAQRAAPGGGGRKRAMFVDLNQDKLPDLVLTHDTGEISVYRNTRGASGAPYAAGPRFKKIQMPTGLGYWNNVSPLTDEHGTVHLRLSEPIKGNGGQVGGGSKNGANYAGKTMVTENSMILRNHGNFKFSPLTQMVMTEDLKSGWEVLMESIGLGGYNGSGGSSGVGVTKDGWMNVAGPYRLARKNGHQWIGVRLPDSVPFYNATIYVDSVNDRTGQIRKQSKQNVNSSGMGLDQSKIVYFDLGKDTRVLHLEVNTIYDGNRWVHPNPRINMIATFRSMLSNPYTAN